MPGCASVLTGSEISLGMTSNVHSMRPGFLNHNLCKYCGYEALIPVKIEEEIENGMTS